MGRTSFVHYAAALAVALSPLSVAAHRKPQQRDATAFIEMCGPSAHTSLAWCDGYISGIESQMRWDYVDEICPPPIGRIGDTARGYLQFLMARPERIKRPMVDTVFENLASVYGCRIKKM